MEARRNLHMFHELPGKAVLELADRPLNYGLELIVEVGTGCGPMSASFSARPMHAPELRPPVHGTPLISGMSGLAAVVVNPSGEFGTMNGVHTVVKVSSSSPASHAASGTECVG